MKRLLSILLLLSVPAAFGEDVKVQYRLMGLFQPDRVDDLRRQAGELPLNDKNNPVEVKLVEVNYDTAAVTFSYDSESKDFKSRKPEQVIQRIDTLLRQASRGAFSVSPLSALKPEQLRKERIAVAGHDCKGCNFGLYRAIASLDGVERAVASFKEGHVTAWIDPTKTNREALVVALKKKEVDLVDETDADKIKTRN